MAAMAAMHKRHTVAKTIAAIGPAAEESPERRGNDGKLLKTMLKSRLDIILSQKSHDCGKRNGAPRGRLHECRNLERKRG